MNAGGQKLYNCRVRIGIDISQLAFGSEGVANYLRNLVESLALADKKNDYILFYSSLRRPVPSLKINNPKFKIKAYKFPPTFLERLWNKFHIFPIENFVGSVDWFITSDWTEPPVKKAKKATIIYDLIVYKYPEETHNLVEINYSGLKISPNIVASQQGKLKWVKKESDMIFTISEASKKDIVDILGIDSSKIRVIYPGV